MLGLDNLAILTSGQNGAVVKPEGRDGGEGIDVQKLVILRGNGCNDGGKGTAQAVRSLPRRTRSKAASRLLRRTNEVPRLARWPKFMSSSLRVCTCHSSCRVTARIPHPTAATGQHTQR